MHCGILQLIKEVVSNKKASKSIVFKDELDYIRRWVDIYSAMSLEEDKWLSPREKDFFCITVWMYRHNYDLLKGKEIYPKYKTMGNFSTKNGEVSGYRRALKRKEWMIATRQSVTLPQIFKDFGDDLSINIRIQVEDDSEGENT